MADEANVAVLETEEAVAETQELETSTDETEGPVSIPNPSDEEQEGADETPEGGESEGDEESAGAVEPEWAEIEIDGQTYQVPEEIKSSFMKSADYTQKTQEVAEQRRQIETAKQQLEVSRQASDEELNARAFVINADQQLAQYEQTDWNALEEEDFVAAQRNWRDYQTLKGQREQAAQHVQQAQHHRANEMERETANRAEVTRDYAQKEIKGWSPEVDEKVTNFAVTELGFTPQQLKQSISPPIYKTLHLAWLGHQAAQNGTAVRPSKASATIKPLKSVSSKTSAGNVTKSPSEMSMDEYAKYAKGKYKDS